ncbi:S8 family serine peptidase [Leadbetterella byssophila]|uniref:S8 family serine peptidase n=1 Tax=Leadbetterella byssophila TaxID=316068 RepID=UPI0039A1FC16
MAILDSGVDLDHEDLTDNMGAGYDATGGSSNGDDWYFHGTAVAGVAAARGDNSKGVRGVAYYSTIIPVRFYNSASGWSTTESGYLQSAIQWIRTGNRADIINMSFTITQTTSLNSEINTAASSGRGGKGIVMVASSGNNNSTSIGYPSSNSNVISVGASNQFRQRVSPTSSDGTSDSDFLGSNYGSGLDIVAPGLNIRSTNIAGTIPANFYLYYKGTSYSAPQVSGAAALVLSVNSNLTREQVKNILESTADKIGTYTYSSGAGENPSLTWNSEMGYGRLNACRAVTIAKAGKINGSDLVCSNSTFTLDAIPAGATISWSSSNTGILTINSSTGVATRVGSGSGSVTITSTLNASCGSVQLTKVVWVGNPDLTKRINGTIAGTTPVNPGNLYNLTAESQSPSTSFNYNNYTGSGDMVIDIYYPNSANTQMYVYGTSTNGSRHVRVTATNSCGSYYQDFVFYIPSFFKSVYPNPAKDYLTLDFNDLTEKATLPDAIELYNEASMKKELVLNIDDVLKDTKNQQGNKYILDIKDLKRGVWYLHAVKKGYKTEVIRLLFE